jgi:hypothetical protein
LGSWGDVVCALSVQTRSWTQLRVSWERPRTVFGFWPNYTIEVSTSPSFSAVLQQLVSPWWNDTAAVANSPSSYPLLFADVSGLMVNEDYFVRVSVSQPGLAVSGPWKVMSLGRTDCDCAFTDDPCTASIATATRPVRPVLSTVTTPASVFSSRGGDVILVTGSGLGLVSGDVTLVYSNRFTQRINRTYTAMGCVVLVPNTQVHPSFSATRS